MPDYEVKIKYHESTASENAKYRHNLILKIFNGISIGNKQTETSTINIFSETGLEKKELEDILGSEIAILSFEEVK